MASWNLADILEAIAESDPTRPAQVTRHASGERRFSWGELHARANGVAQALIARGAQRQDKFAQYLWNGPEYMEAAVAAFLAGLVPVNTNYRYVERELLYLWDNADVVAVVFHGSFTPRIEAVKDQLPRIHTWLWVDDGSGPCPPWALGYEEVAAAGSRRLDLPWPRSGDDLYLLYTGGTTGMPKGVMWRQDDIWQLINRGRLQPFDLAGGLAGLRDQLPTHLERRVSLPACPLMHGTGFLTALGCLLNGGCVVTIEARTFDPAAVLQVIADEKVQGMAIVGDAFAKPLLRALDEQPGRWDITSLIGVVSSGVMWSEEVKRALLRHHPGMILTDSLGSSESVGMGRSDSTGGTTEGTALFQPGVDTIVIDEDGRRLAAGSGVIGRIAVGGFIPVGYYKDAEKSARTFLTIDGQRYAVAGDYATVEPDGRLRLYGRGSVCINTGGEKVFPEEVEEVLKRHAAVRDALCVGVPDERFGQAITGVVELQEAAADESGLERELIRWVKQELAAYKAPKRVLFRPSLGRAPNGKADYNGVRVWATRAVQAAGPAEPAAGAGSAGGGPAQLR